MTERERVYALVKQSIERYVGEDCPVLRPDSLLDDELALDSTEMVCIAVELEAALGLSLKGARLGKCRTPCEVVDGIVALLSPPSEVDPTVS